jgi:UDP-N-acetylmuramoyl-tripeptide--D-alanyl-D-alanine ligase
MRAITLEQILNAAGGKALSQPNTNFTGIGTDTRVDLSGQLFIALKGESFDAHQFLQKAVDQKAAAVMIQENEASLEQYKNKITIIKVKDTLKALQALGRWARRQSKAKVIGITGSNGKTTVKEFTAALIGSVKDVHLNQGSFNNHWGVPFTLLQLDPKKEIALVEMGMNHAGEITELVQMTEPDVVICTMVGRAHIEYFGTIEKIAEAKEEIYLAAPKAVQVFNLDNEQTYKMYERAKERNPSGSYLTFSSHKAAADVQLQIITMTMTELHISGKIRGHQAEAKVQVFGAQNLTNLMAAATLGLAVGMSPEQVWQGLTLCRTNWGRNQLVNLKSKAQMIFDAYNANPDSMKALVENIKLLKNSGKKIGVFGEMLEMGEQSPELHKELGNLVGKAGFDKVYFVGAHARDFFEGLKLAQFSKACLVEKEFKPEMAESLCQELQEGDIAVIKGSRGMKLERFVMPCNPLDFSPKT